jgi:hypothetical protein
LKAGTRILVINGASRGLVGVVRGASKFSFDGERVWTVKLDAFAHESSIRESFLVPEPERSDEDVLGPLRNVRCP